MGRAAPKIDGLKLYQKNMYTLFEKINNNK
jgi:hypothetical protein